MAVWLRKQRLAGIAAKFQQNGIDGEALLTLEHADLRRVHAWRVAAAHAFGSTPPPAGALEVGGMLAPPLLRDRPVLLKRV